MTQEDKELLFKDLCGRLPYGIIVDYKDDEYDFHHWKISTLHALSYSQSGILINTDSDGWFEIKPNSDMFVEYVRKDVFIEKTINFLNYKLDDVVATRVSDTIIPHHVAKQELIEDFRNYIQLKYEV